MKAFKSLLMLLMALVAFSCTKVTDEDLEGAKVVAPDLNFVEVNAPTAATSGDTLAITATLLNEGGFDSTGHFIYLKVDGQQVAFTQTATVAEDSSVSVEFNWVAVAGPHDFILALENRDDALAQEAQTFSLNVAVRQIAVTAKKAIEAVEEQAVTEEIFTGVTAGTTVEDVFANVDSILIADTDLDDNETVVLETVQLLADADLTIASDLAMTAVTFEDTTVEAVIMPLAAVVIDEVTGEETTVLDTTSYFIAVSVEEEVVTASSVGADGVEIVTAKETQVTSVPVSIQINESETSGSFESVVVENAVGGLEIDVTTGAISLLSFNRAVDSDFWIVMAEELDAAALKLATALQSATTRVDIYNAIVAFVNDFTSIMVAYEMQSAMQNEAPVIIVTPSQGEEKYRQGDDMIVITWDIYTAEVSDDKAGASIVGAAVFNPGVDPALATKTHTFTAVDADGVQVTKEVVSKYKRVVIVDVFVHDQGASGN